MGIKITITRTRYRPVTDHRRLWRRPVTDLFRTIFNLGLEEVCVQILNVGGRLYLSQTSSVQANYHEGEEKHFQIVSKGILNHYVDHIWTLPCHNSYHISNLQACKHFSSANCKPGNVMETVPGSLHCEIVYHAVCPYYKKDQNLKVSNWYWVIPFRGPYAIFLHLTAPTPPPPPISSENIWEGQASGHYFLANKCFLTFTSGTVTNCILIMFSPLWTVYSLYF